MQFTPQLRAFPPITTPHLFGFIRQSLVSTRVIFSRVIVIETLQLSQPAIFSGPTVIRYLWSDKPCMGNYHLKSIPSVHSWSDRPDETWNAKPSLLADKSHQQPDHRWSRSNANWTRPLCVFSIVCSGNTPKGPANRHHSISIRIPEDHLHLVLI